MDETSLLDWFGCLMTLNGGPAALKMSRSREGFVARFGSFTSAPYTDLVDCLTDLKDALRKAMTVGV